MNQEPVINVVLVTPEIPQNTGNIIRLCANTGSKLHLVEPLGFSLDSAGLKRAALDYGDIADIVLHSSLATFLQSLPSRGVYGAVVDGPVSYTCPRYLSGDTIVFGPESTGLPHEVSDLFEAQNLIHIPMAPTNRSLNLSNAVAIVVYEMWRQMAFVGSNS